jgi:hypothetical protein
MISLSFKLKMKKVKPNDLEIIQNENEKRSNLMILKSFKWKKKT